MGRILNNKTVILGVCGGIAAYKSVELLRLLTKEGAVVKVMMTKNAQQFVGKLTFEALTGQPVCDNLFEDAGASIRHIEWAKEADAVVIAPATANMVGKIAGGIADDALSTLLLAVNAPVLVCPSMNTFMYQNRTVQKNLNTLKEDGYILLEPGSGELACKTAGPGRLPEPPDILDRIECALTPKDFIGKHVLITAGPTQEYLDPVRFISNPSSGKMGYAVARAAEHRGAKVTLISGPVTLSDPQNVKVIRITSASEMADAVFDHMQQADIIVKAAAVSDYRPKHFAEQKIKKLTDEMAMRLEKTQDILKELGQKKTKQILVGFAAETENLTTHAELKLKEKNLDIIVGNLINQADSGFGTDTNQVTLFYRSGDTESLPVMSKDDVAHRLLDRIGRICQNDSRTAIC